VRTLDPSYLNEVANHPKVRPWLKGEGDVDLSPMVSDPSNIALQFEGGGWVLRNLGACQYEVHSMFVPEVRGAKVRDNLKAALEYVFLQTDAVKLVTQLPEGNVAARALARIAGFRLWFGEYHVLCIEDWIQASDACLQAGQQFHEKLEAAKLKSGSALVIHEDDDAHDRAAGASFLMCNADNPAKGVWHYNQWATVAGYAQVSLLSVSPPMVDIVDAVIGKDMEVLLCR